MTCEGITEAFVYSVASKQAHKFLTALMVVFSMVYLGIAIVLVNRHGTIGMVLANCISIQQMIVVMLLFGT